MSSFAVRVKELRTAKGLTQKQAAEIFGIGARHWQKYELEERTPTFEGLIALADYFDVPIDYLVGRSDNPKMQ